MRPILLDTCALIWLAIGGLSSPAKSLLDEGDTQALVSPISAWELGTLAARGRVTLAAEPQAWFRRALDAGLSLAPMPWDVLLASTQLTAPTLRDPADRILAATARTYGYRLMTRDRPLLEFGRMGHLQVVAC
jgi:PIN domain nuclease of toxin-antitoxin system